MITNFQLILLSTTYDAVNNPFKHEDPYGGRKYGALSIGCRWQCNGQWVTKFQGFPDQARRKTIDADMLSKRRGSSLAMTHCMFARPRNLRRQVIDNIDSVV